MDNAAACIQVSTELAKLLNANGSVTIEDGEYPATSIYWSNSHLLLVRHFGSSFSVSLPTEPGSFSYRSMEELTAGISTLSQAIDTYRTQHANVITMADAVARLRPMLPTDNGTWKVTFPGTPVPAEGWLENDKNQIGLFQEGDSVRVIMWVGKDMRILGLSSQEKLAHLPEWVLSHLQAQVDAAVRLADEDAKRAAIEPPALEKALDALRAGKRIQLGGGRWYEVYFMADGKLRREIFDEGHHDEEDATEEQFEASMKSNAEQAQRQLSQS